MNESKLDEIHKDIILVKQAVYGNGVPGLNQRVSWLEEDNVKHNTFKTQFMTWVTAIGCLTTLLGGIFGYFINLISKL